MTFPSVKSVRFFSYLICLFFLTNAPLAEAQIKVDLSTLTAFNNPTANWKLVGNVNADINKPHTFTYAAGKGILMNLPDSTAHKDLFTAQKFGDVDIELDCMMAKESNSGIYLQGRYELQLLDSWGVLNPRSSDMGGIYERNDGKRPEGQRNFDGRGPRQNASKAPGLWQHFKISFQAPRFENGKKVANAKFLKIELNGVVVQENIDLSGTTAGAISKIEVPEDALRIQGDHGQVAFKNIIITDFKNPKPTIGNLHLDVFAGKIEQEPQFATMKPIMQKTPNLLTINLEGVPKNSYVLHYKGVFTAPEAGTYTFNTIVRGGPMKMLINNTVVYPFSRTAGKVSVDLPQGTLPFDLVMSKYMASENISLIVKVSGPGFREFTLTDPVSPPLGGKDPILMYANENTIVRSFVDLPNNLRISHAVSVGSPTQLHYSYDLNKGAIIQMWRGDFLDASPMWIGRGDGSSKPMGAVQYFGNSTLTINRLNNIDAAWTADTSSTGFQPKGYILDESDRPSFKYNIYGASVTDKTIVLDKNLGLQRTITIKNNPGNLYFQLAADAMIVEVEPGLYIIGDHAYYLKIDNSSNNQPILRTKNGQKELLMPVQDAFTYSFLY